MNSRLQVLASIAEPADVTDKPIPTFPLNVPERLGDLYAISDGFYAFDRSLLVRSLNREAAPRGAKQWNEHGLWQIYFEKDERFFIFAEDAFGDPFLLMGKTILKLNMETGHRTNIAGSIEEWAGLILYNPDLYLNTIFMSDWVKRRGVVPLGFRLAPKIPFVLGGEYSFDNMAVIAELELAEFKSHIASQIKNLPDGTTIELSFK